MAQHDEHHGGEGGADHAEHGVGHVVPMRVLLGTGMALLVLTGVTVWSARSLDFGAANIYIALFIAVLKASLVMMFFMHLWWDRPFNAIVCIGSIGFVALFLALAMTDSAEYQPDLKKGDGPQVVNFVPTPPPDLPGGAAAHE